MSAATSFDRLFCEVSTRHTPFGALLFEWQRKRAVWQQEMGVCHGGPRRHGTLRWVVIWRPPPDMSTNANGLAVGLGTLALDSPYGF